MGINKVQYGNTTLIDLTSDTVTADKLMQGYTAHDRSGAVITGTATGGGSVTQDQDGFIVLPPDGGGGGGTSGLEYESGTWSPSEDVAMPTINFAKTHDSIPIFIMFVDATGTDDQTQSTNYGFSYTAFNAFANSVPSDVSANARYGIASYVYRGTGNPSQSINGITNPSGSSSASYQGFWVTQSGFIPSSSVTTRYWRAGRTYKWIAVWSPTT